MIDHRHDDHVKVTIASLQIRSPWVGLRSRQACWSSAIASTQLSSIYELVLHGASADASRNLWRSIILSDSWRSMRFASPIGQTKKEDANQASSLSRVIAIYRY
jgi:hypothetical protein